MTTEPSSRAFLAHTMLKRIEALPPPARAKINLPGELVTSMRAALPLSYIPLGDLMRLEESIRAGLGDAGFRDFQRQVTMHYLEGPMIKGLWDTAVRLLGLRPEALLKWVPKAWDSMSRGTGTVAHEAGAQPNEARIHMRGFPHQHLRSGTYIITTMAALDAILEMTKHQGTATVGDQDLAAGNVTFVVRWQ